MSTSSPPTPSPRRRSTTVNHRALPPPPPPPPSPSTKPNLTTTLYHTNSGLFALTWSRNLFGRSLYLYLLPSAAAADGDESLSTTTAAATSTADNPSFHLQIKPFFFWNKYGSKKLPGSSPDKPIQVFWDLSRAKFGSGPEPVSGFYIAVLVAGKLTLLVGDSPKQALSKTKSTKPDKTQITVLRREHVHAIGNKKYTTRASFRGKTREITVDCRLAGDDSRLYFSVDHKRVLQVKHLRWKFRGNERIEIDGVHIQISWDVYNWLFEEEDDGHALFMFRFEKSGFDYHEDDKFLAQFNEMGGLGMGFGFGVGGFGFERKKMMKKSGLLRTARSSSSSSLSSASSSCGSVMEWESVEENELKGPSGFSLLVYAWKS